MAILVSPGVDVQIINESMYGSAGPGTVPLIVFATRSNKASPTGTGIAPGTITTEAGKLYLTTSQRELAQTFGNSHFASVQGTPVHGHELNEYGLHAAYQFLGINNRAYVMRADLDLEQLESSVSEPRGNAVDGTHWFDLVDTQFGVFQSSGINSLDPFLKQNLLILSHDSEFDLETGLPVDGTGEDGDFCVITAESNNRMFEKIDNNWLMVGSQAWKFTRNVVRGSAPISDLIAGNSFSINGITITITTNNITQTIQDINDAIAGSVDTLKNKITASTDSAGRLSLHHVLPSMDLLNVTGTPLAAMSITPGMYKSVKLNYAPHNRVPQTSIFGDVWIKTTAINNGSKFVIKSSNAGVFTTVEAPFYANDAAARTALSASLVAGSLYVQFNSEGNDSTPLASHKIKRWSGSVWADLSYEQGYEAPATNPEDGTLWFNADFRADIMVCDGDQWLGYRKMYPLTDASGMQIAGSAPLTQLNGNGLVDNDLWLNASDLENYPKMYRYQANSRRWTAIDNTDQTTPYGVIFSDAREDSGTSYTTDSTVNYAYRSTNNSDMALSSFVDPDCIDPRTFSAGTLLFNTRYSTYNVKKWQGTWFAEGSYDANTDFTFNTYTVGRDDVIFPALEQAGRWVTASGNAVDGSPYMGRKAQRIMVVSALSACIASNQEIRSELVYFNLLAVPGYPELIDEMITLNVDQKEVAFIVGDTPARLKPSGTAIQKWATNANNAASNGDKGLTSASSYVGVYYPWGLSTNVDGTEIMVPPSTIALRTIAYNDQVAYPWFAPAGFTRGLVSNAASVGYLSDEGEYTPVILNQGQRDVLYLNKINPIAYMPNRGLVVYGQKTLSPIESATDRINVARLANYLKYNLDNLSKPFLFEQNDLQTRDSFKITIERFLVGLVGLRALQDFAVLCDTSNNTPERRDRNELWCDIFIQPIKSIEFIYLPVRIRNSGDSLS